ncbi:Altered inheritance of mitochondria protein 6 -like protein [Trametes pubescens]|uniref:Altered inheritance of mitochondria protein 6 n=1 Tax=Trametes pubescens TaxID=154538 RepID=A0A1M2VIR6_TRAPU|nr:Altered inheritance of mitochondria protein 6 -like protein [Trametes pubescens]
MAKPGIDQQIAQLEGSNSKLLQYPTQFTQGIMPKMIHSHNDSSGLPVSRRMSLSLQWDAFREFHPEKLRVYRACADFHHAQVGHEAAALTPDRTLDSLYIQPLLQILKKQNPRNAFTANSTSPNGVFDTASGTPLQLLIDIKTDGVEALPFILKALQPLRAAGYLTTALANGTITPSAVTVVGTGNSPLAQVKALSPRDYFFDAPLTQLTDPSLNTTWDPTLSPLASTDYETAVGWNGIGNITDEQRANITRFVGDAHARGITARFWDTPAWPVHARENIWRTLSEEGADWLNADDLAAASSF